MVFDLVAGTKLSSHARPLQTLPEAPRVLVFDSGLGGLTVYPEVTATVPGGRFLYVADDAVFPYGGLREAALVTRVLDVLGVAIDGFAPDLVVIACHTASTLVLPPLRAAWPAVDFVGTVPAIKPAVTGSASRMVSVLGTPGTVAREYTRDLVAAFAGDCAVTLVGARRLATIAEGMMRGAAVDEAAITGEIAPAFVATEAGPRTDAVVLACTHYPLLLPHLQRLAPWPVRWIDPAPAIARRVGQVLGQTLGQAPGSGPARGSAADQTGPRLSDAMFTSNRPPGPELAAFLAARGLKWQSSAALAALPMASATD